MFFKNIDKWSKKLLWGVTILCYALYTCFLTIAPAITIMVKYNVFEKTEHHRGLTGFGLIVAIIFGLYAFFMVKKQLVKLPQESIQEQRFKFGVECVFDVLPFAAIIYFLFTTRDDVKLAFDTFMICMWFILVAILIDALCIKFIDAEWAIRRRAKANKEAKKREDIV